MKKLVWSYSSLDAYDGTFGCPRKWYEEKITRRYKDKGGALANEGIVGHAAFEDYLLKDKVLPLDLRHHGKQLDVLKAYPGDGMPEQKLALNADFEPTGFFDDDVWVRGIVDYAKHNDNQLIVTDFKFGKVRPGFDQVSLMVAMMMCYFPEVDTAMGAYYWAKAKKFASIKIHRSDTPAIWNSFMPRLARLEKALKTTDFPAKPGGLCRRYCPVTSCPYHGVGG